MFTCFIDRKSLLQSKPTFNSFAELVFAWLKVQVVRADESVDVPRRGRSGRPLSFRSTCARAAVLPGRSPVVPTWRRRNRHFPIVAVLGRRYRLAVR